MRRDKYNYDSTSTINISTTSTGEVILISHSWRELERTLYVLLHQTNRRYNCEPGDLPIRHDGDIDWISLPPPPLIFPVIIVGVAEL